MVEANDISAGDADASRRPLLRVGLLIDGFTQSRWIADIIDQIRTSDVAELVLVIRNEENPVPPPGSFAEKLRRYLRGFVYRQYEKWDGGRYDVADDPFDSIDISDRVANLPVIAVKPRMTRFSDFFDDASVDAILEHRLDVALRFGFRILKGRSLTIAKHGVWSYHHGDNTVNRGGPPGFWEVAEGHPVTGSILQILTEELDNGHAISRTWAATHPTSLKLNRAQYYRMSTPMVIRKLADLRDRGVAALEDPLGSGYKAYTQRLYRRPDNAAAARAFVRIGSRLVRRKIRQQLAREQWQLAYKIKPEGQGVVGVPDPTFYNYKPIVPPSDRFWADPFPFERDGTTWVFLEEMIYGREHGHVAVQEFGPKGPVGQPRQILSTEYHISFPNVFSLEGDEYMLPESLQAGRVELFGCVRWPDRWERAAVLLDDIAAVDPVLEKIGDLWWLFLTTDAGTGASWDELRIYYAESPFGPWTPHRRNPLKVDVRSSRSAGRLFRTGGRIYRPAQNGAPQYGSGITVNEILRLTPEEFEEEEATSILPEWSRDITGVHTMNAAGRLSVIDVRKRVWRWQYGRG